MIIKSARKFWKRRFAFLPVVLNDGPDRTLIWLEWVWVRDGGMYTEVSLFDPEASCAPDGAATRHTLSAPDTPNQNGSDQ